MRHCPQLQVCLWLQAPSTLWRTSMVFLLFSGPTASLFTGRMKMSSLMLNYVTLMSLADFWPCASKPKIWHAKFMQNMSYQSSRIRALDSPAGHFLQLHWWMCGRRCFISWSSQRKDQRLHQVSQGSLDWTWQCLAQSSFRNNCRNSKIRIENMWCGSFWEAVSIVAQSTRWDHWQTKSRSSMISPKGREEMAWRSLSDLLNRRDYIDLTNEVPEETDLEITEDLPAEPNNKTESLVEGYMVNTVKLQRKLFHRYHQWMNMKRTRIHLQFLMTWRRQATLRHRRCLAVAQHPQPSPCWRILRRLLLHSLLRRGRSLQFLVRLQLVAMLQNPSEPRQTLKWTVTPSKNFAICLTMQTLATSWKCSVNLTATESSRIFYELLQFIWSNNYVALRSGMKTWHLPSRSSSTGPKIEKFPPLWLRKLSCTEAEEREGWESGRVIGCRWVLTWKDVPPEDRQHAADDATNNDQTPFTPSGDRKSKARIVLLGYQHPDLLKPEFRSSAPVQATTARYLTFALTVQRINGGLKG